jgi:hypothetical protein
MPVPKWYVIAKNEFRIRTYPLRKIRIFLLPLIFVILAFYIAILAPAMTRPFFDIFDIPADYSHS